MYSVGKHRLFYQSKGGGPLDVTAKVLTPELEHRGPWSMTRIDAGLYYIDIWFASCGSYVFYVYEDEEQKHRDILLVDNPGYVLYPDMSRLI